MTLKIFRWTFHCVWFKRDTRKKELNGHGMSTAGFKLRVINGYLHSVDENGDPWPKAQISCKLKDRVNEISTVTITAPFAGFYED